MRRTKVPQFGTLRCGEVALDITNAEKDRQSNKLLGIFSVPASDRLWIDLVSPPHRLAAGAASSDTKRLCAYARHSCKNSASGMPQ